MQIRPLRGFDRLQAAGFSAEDIASIRRQFHSESSNNLSDTGLDGEDRQSRVSLCVMSREITYILDSG